MNFRNFLRLLYEIAQPFFIFFTCFELLKLSGPKRSDGPAKIEQTLELISVVFEVMLSCDPEMCPQPDVQTELSSVVHAQNRKPSVCEITLNQPLTNPQLLQLHQQLISCCKFHITLKISFDIEKLFSEV